MTAILTICRKHAYSHFLCTKLDFFVYISKYLCHKYLETFLLHFPVHGASPYI